MRPEQDRETSGRFAAGINTAPEVSFGETAEEKTQHRFIIIESAWDDGFDEDMYSARCRDCDYASDWEDSADEAACWGANHHNLMVFGMVPETGRTKRRH
jgi:hypothetical protein